MKASNFQILLFVALLGAATVLLPACGGNKIKSADTPTTMMNPAATPDTSLKSAPAMSGSVEKNSKPGEVQKASTSKMTAASTASMTSAPTPVATIAAITAAPAVETSAPAHKRGSHFLWWLLLILILAGLGWYFWSKNHNDDDEFQPHPPSGGLSPVSGYTGLKGLSADEKKNKSIWTRKLF
ncbi:MAG: hypothetical protein ACREL1_07370 [bacterium]